MGLQDLKAGPHCAMGWSVWNLWHGMLRKRVLDAFYNVYILSLILFSVNRPLGRSSKQVSQVHGIAKNCVPPRLGIYFAAWLSVLITRIIRISATQRTEVTSPC